MSKIKEIMKDWKQASAFLINGMVCGDWKFQDKKEKDDSFNFYIYTADNEIIEIDFDFESMKDGLYNNNILVLTDYKNQTISIEPLFTKDFK